MRQIIAVEAKSSGSQVVWKPGRLPVAAISIWYLAAPTQRFLMRSAPVGAGFFGRIGSGRHFSHSPMRSPSSPVFTSLINDPAIQALLMTVAV
jgi:hypothetical protein